MRGGTKGGAGSGIFARLLPGSAFSLPHEDSPGIVSPSCLHAAPRPRAGLGSEGAMGSGGGGLGAYGLGHADEGGDDLAGGAGGCGEGSASLRTGGGFRLGRFPVGPEASYFC